MPPGFLLVDSQIPGMHLHYKYGCKFLILDPHCSIFLGDDLFGGSEGEWLHDKFAEMEAEGGEGAAEEDDNKPSSTTEK